MNEWDDIEKDVQIVGINKKVWSEFRKMTEKYEQPDLDGFAQAEAEANQAVIDRETFIRHKEAMAKRWFGYYRKCKDQQKKMSLIDQYNKIAQMKQR